MQFVRIQAEDFDPAQLQGRLFGDAGDTGAIATFTGYVRREVGRAGFSGLYIEHYPGMTEASIEQTLAQATTRWPLLAAGVVHRVGDLALGERIVWVGVSSSHRSAAFEACEYIMDVLKSSAPLWKRELGPGDARWIAARTSDTQRAARWNEQTARCDAPDKPGALESL